jgi:alpha-1,2-mannosyltransferase
LAAAVLTAWFLCRMPWWGISWLNHQSWPELPGRVLQNADTFGALLALALLGWSLSRTIPLRAHGHPHRHDPHHHADHVSRDEAGAPRSRAAR